jgi:hypothetical protein
MPLAITSGLFPIWKATIRLSRFVMAPSDKSGSEFLIFVIENEGRDEIESCPSLFYFFLR